MNSVAEAAGAVLIVDGDILSRHALADYLRQCGYTVVEAVSTDEAHVALADAELEVDVILCDIDATGRQSAFELAQWVRQHRPELEVKIAASLKAAAEKAAELCENGPNLARPYEPRAVVDYIKQLRAARDRA
ncbi:MAG: response regulator [Alphaproteobacteria bacterium]|nr:MAG: response regulator [Alphaproteobacteria bacterium]